MTVVEFEVSVSQSRTLLFQSRGVESRPGGGGVRATLETRRGWMQIAQRSDRGSRVEDADTAGGSQQLLRMGRFDELVSAMAGTGPNFGRKIGREVL